MSDPMLETVRSKFIRLLRRDPPREPLALDRYVASRFTREEIDVLLRAEREYGEAEMSEWLAEVLLEAGIVRPPLRRAG